MSGKLMSNKIKWGLPLMAVWMGRFAVCSFKDFVAVSVEVNGD